MSFGNKSELSSNSEVTINKPSFRDIEVADTKTTDQCKSFWRDLFSDIIDNKNNNSDIQPEQGNDVENSIKSFSSLDEMKSQLDVTYKDLNESKPQNSPNIVKWFEKGGTIEISEKDGSKIWTYINPEGVAVSYIDGYPVFPPETKHPYIDDISIGEFRGDRNEDKRIYLEKLEEEYGLTEIPKGYALHHDSENGTMQLVKEEYHKEFTHAGGHSKFKEDTDVNY